LDVAVVTSIGEMPVHLEFFDDREAYVREKAYLIDALRPGGTAVLNRDDATVFSFSKRLREAQRVVTYGTHADANVRVSDITYITDVPRAGEMGVEFVITVESASSKIFIHGTLGKGVSYATAATVAVSRAQDRALSEIVQSFKNFTPLSGRMRVIEGTRESIIIDDTYNASPIASSAALEGLAAFSRRRVAVMGDMRELGVNTEEAHRVLGHELARTADVVVLVGEYVKTTYITLQNAGFTVGESVWHVANSNDAAELVKRLIKPGDAVLIKGSQRVRLERVVQAVMADPQRAPELLVRQEKRWRRE
jgi:UDP-N-acetylmuramyl pentapeptide synthase